MLRTADVVAAGPADPAGLARQVAGQLVDLLGVADCRFEPAGRREGGTSATVLLCDGSVTRYGAPLDVDRHGLPTDDLVALDVGRDGTRYGRFLLAASTRVVRPSAQQRRVAALLADQVAAAFAARGAPPPVARASGSR